MPRYFPSELLAVTIGRGGGGDQKKCSFSFSRAGVKTIKLVQFLLGRQYDSEMVSDRKALRVETHLAGTGGVGGGGGGEPNVVRPRKYLNSQTGS